MSHFTVSLIFDAVLSFFCVARGSARFFKILVCCTCVNIYLYVTPHIFVLQCKEKGAFTVVVDGYVKEEEGTGVVHQAPYFGAVSVNYTFMVLILFSTRLLAFQLLGTLSG